MTKLEKLREEFGKAEITLANARKRVSMLKDKIKKEEQRELEKMMESRGLSVDDVLLIIGSTPSENNGGVTIEKDTI